MCAVTANSAKTPGPNIRSTRYARIPGPPSNDADMAALREAQRADGAPRAAERSPASTCHPLAPAQTARPVASAPTAVAAAPASNFTGHVRHHNT